MRSAHFVLPTIAVVACAAVVIISCGAISQTWAGVAGTFWDKAASDGKTQTAATPAPTPQSKATAEKSAVGNFWDNAASGAKTVPAKQTAQPPDPTGPREPAEPTQDIANWQRTKFLGIVDILFPPDAKKYTEHKNDIFWTVGRLSKYKLMFRAEMVRDPMAKTKTMKDIKESKAVLNGPVGKNWITCRQFDGIMNVAGKYVPTRLIFTTDPLPNGWYLAFYVGGKDLKARQNDVDAFFENIRIHTPEGDDIWQWHEFNGLKFKTPWGWQLRKNNKWSMSYKGYDRKTGREMIFGLNWMKSPYEKSLPELEKVNNVTRLGAKDLGGIPVRMYELSSEPGKPFASTLEASVQVPLKSGGYIYISGSIVGGDKWGDARQDIDEMIQSVSAPQGVLDMSAAPAAVPKPAATPEAQPTSAVPVQLPEPPVQPAQQPSDNALPNGPLPETIGNLPMTATPTPGVNTTPDTAAPETQGNLPIPAATEQAPPAVPEQTSTGNPTPSSAPPETIGNLPMTATPTPGVNATPDTAAPETQGNLPIPAATEQAPPVQTPDPAMTPAPAATQGSGMAESSCKLKTLRGFYDMTGRGEELQGDGSPEAVLQLKIKAPGRTVEALTLKSTQGQPSQWDTIPGNGNWLAVITEKGKALNNPDGSINIKLGDKPRKFGLLVQDNNSLASGKGAFVVQLRLDGGETVDIPVQQ